MKEDCIKPSDVGEPTVTFKLESDRDCYEITNPDVEEALIQILGYDIQFRFNSKYLKTVEDIEAACNGIHSLFRDLITSQLLSEGKQQAEI